MQNIFDGILLRLLIVHFQGMVKQAETKKESAIADSFTYIDNYIGLLICSLSLRLGNNFSSSSSWCCFDNLSTTVHYRFNFYFFLLCFRSLS